jgi:hypothetical protein
MVAIQMQGLSLTIALQNCTIATSTATSYSYCYRLYYRVYFYTWACFLFFSYILQLIFLERVNCYIDPGKGCDKEPGYCSLWLQLQLVRIQVCASAISGRLYFRHDPTRDYLIFVACVMFNHAWYCSSLVATS